MDTFVDQMRLSLSLDNIPFQASQFKYDLHSFAIAVYFSAFNPKIRFSNSIRVQ